MSADLLEWAGTGSEGWPSHTIVFESYTLLAWVGLDGGGAPVGQALLASQIRVLGNLGSENNCKQFCLLAQSMARCQRQTSTDLQPFRHAVEDV